MTSLVKKKKTKPKRMENGNAGKALLQIARNMRVKHKPMRMATKQAKVVFQSPSALAFPTRME